MLFFTETCQMRESKRRTERNFTLTISRATPCGKLARVVRARISGACAVLIRRPCNDLKNIYSSRYPSSSSSATRGLKISREREGHKPSQTTYFSLSRSLSPSASSSSPSSSFPSVELLALARSLLLNDHKFVRQTTKSLCTPLLLLLLLLLLLHGERGERERELCVSRDS